ncbi:MAG: FtsX-like permease family protein [Clostridium sp.]|nr:FtsX-like permease family protein [Clostridium sp.]
MQKILKKRILRDLRENVFRYLALGFLIILGMYLVVSLVGAADTIMLGTADAAKENRLEDGQFGLFVPLTERERSGLEEDGITLEPHFYLDYCLADDSILRVFSKREEIDLPQADQGRLPQKEGEIFLEKRYCEEHGILPGDEIVVGGYRFFVCGIGSSPDYDAPYRNLSDSAVDSALFGTGFLTDEDYNRLNGEKNSTRSEEYVYAYRLNGKLTQKEFKKKLQELKIDAGDIDDRYFQEYWERTGGKLEDFKKALDELTNGAGELSDSLDELKEASAMPSAGTAGIFSAYLDGAADGAEKLSDGLDEFSDETKEFLDDHFDVQLSKLTQFTPADDNIRIGAAADDQFINKAGGLAAGVIILILFAYVISVFVVHSIERESGIIGTLYAMGVKKNELLRHYLTLPVLITLIAGIVGTLLGYSNIGVKVQMKDCYAYYSVPDLEVRYVLYLLVYGMVMPPVAAALTNFFVIRKKLARPALSLIRNEQKIGKTQNIRIRRGSFVHIFQIRQLLRERRTAITVFFGMFISLLIVMLSLNCYVLCNHIKVDNRADTKFAYMYTYKYPEKQVPKDGEAAYGVTLKKEVLGYNLDVTLLGIDKDNPYFAIENKNADGRFCEENQVQISSAMAQKYHLDIGDDLVLKDEENDRNYAFTIEAVVPYSTSFFAFMDIDSMRELMGEEEDYYNIVFADHALDIDSGRLFASTSKEEIEKSAAVFVSQMMPMIVTMLAASALIFMVVMYLMMKVMIDRSAISISLMKVFGYRKGEVRKLYLNGNLLVVAVSALVGIPLSKVIMNSMYPYLVSNVACGINLTFSWQMYAGLFGAILILYFIINSILMHRVNQILPAEVLKNRE